uniref:Uncharacterized protein n=1 Tax=Sinorhizobium sp. M14 TaxID=430451 RepID=A0A142BPM4_9HYPH|nr:hypothetical protein pSinB_173 [Sinorhizobium sp. M14]
MEGVICPRNRRRLIKVKAMHAGIAHCARRKHGVSSETAPMKCGPHIGGGEHVVSPQVKADLHAEIETGAESVLQTHLQPALRAVPGSDLRRSHPEFRQSESFVGEAPSTAHPRRLKTHRHSGLLKI